MTGSRKFEGGMSAEQQFVTKDSGVRAAYDSGMVRDTQEGKARFDYLRPKGVPYSAQFMTRVADLMTRGAEKYGPRNWELAGSQEELDRFEGSAERHLEQYLAGETDEDHAAAVVFNLLAAETTRWKIAREAERETEAILSDPETMDAIAEGTAEPSRREEPPAPNTKILLTVRYQPTGDNDPWGPKRATEAVFATTKVCDIKVMMVGYFGFGNPDGFELQLGGRPLWEDDMIGQYNITTALHLVRLSQQEVTVVGDHETRAYYPGCYNSPLSSPDRTRR